ncbi:hypothetical protein WGA93_24630 (plasmid) [Escherichia coli]
MPHCRLSVLDGGAIHGSISAMTRRWLPGCRCDITVHLKVIAVLSTLVIWPRAGDVLARFPEVQCSAQVFQPRDTTWTAYRDISGTAPDDKPIPACSRAVHGLSVSTEIMQMNQLTEGTCASAAANTATAAVIFNQPANVLCASTAMTVRVIVNPQQRLSRDVW